MSAYAEVSLREVTRETVQAVCGLDVRPDQREYVAPNAFSIAEAYFEPRAWFRAIYAGETPVGFLMMFEDTAEGAYFLWRLMIASEFQGNGYGRRALDLVVEEIRTRPQASEIRSSYVDGADGPGGFYRAYGFAETGEVEHGEIVIRFPL
jgi:diamine N-acetyltransferase